MSLLPMNRRALLSRLARNLTGLGLLANSQVSARQESAYRSPYRLRFRNPVEELEAGFAEAPWNGAQFESAVPAQEWYSPRVLHKFGAWGPPARQYPAPPAGLDAGPGDPRDPAARPGRGAPGPAAPDTGEPDPAWMQDRVIHAASF